MRVIFLAVFATLAPLAPALAHDTAADPPLHCAALITLSGQILADDGQASESDLAQVRKIATKLGEGEGTLGKLINDDAVYGDVQQIAANLRQISDAVAKGEGTLGKLVADEQLYDEVQAVASNLRQATDSVANGEGVLGRLLDADDPMAGDLSATLASFRSISESIAKGEGTIGKLVTDEELYVEFKALVNEGRAAVDDIRETSPITTFTSIFFGAF